MRWHMIYSFMKLVQGTIVNGLLASFWTLFGLFLVGFYGPPMQHRLHSATDIFENKNYVKNNSKMQTFNMMVWI